MATPGGVAVAGPGRREAEGAPFSFGTPFLSPRGDVPILKVMSSYRNLVIITLDCVRPDFLGCYGCRQVRTPTLDRMASRGVVFEQALTQAPNTWVSHAGILTGLYPPRHGLRSPYDRIDPAVPTLASLLARHGFGCAGFPGNDLVGSRMGFAAGFDLFFERYRLEGGAGEGEGGKTANNRNRWGEMLEAADQWLGRVRDRVFLWFHYLDTHHLPECDLPDLYRWGGDPLWQFYEGKISYADERCLRAVIELLQRHGRYEDTLVVVLSDHGEELAPGRPPVHNGRLSEAVLRVPLVIFGEGSPWRGHRASELVRTVDLVPTLLALLLGHPAGGMAEEGGEGFSGRPLPLPGLDAGGRAGEGGETAYAENEPLGLFCLRATEWKLTVGPEGEGLYHLRSDPGEDCNLLDRHPSTARFLREELRRIRGQGRGRMPADREEEETRRLLQAFGYLD